MKIFFAVLIALCLCCSPLAAAEPKAAQSAESDIAALRATYEAWVAAWNKRDTATIAEIAAGCFGFGRDVPFARGGNPDKASYQRGLEGYMKLMDDISYETEHTEYKVIGNTGLVWGFYGQTTKQVDGPSRTVYGRQSLTFVKGEDGKWKMIMYHRSTIPDEFVR